MVTAVNLTQGILWFLLSKQAPLFLRDAAQLSEHR